MMQNCASGDKALCMHIVIACLHIFIGGLDYQYVSTNTTFNSGISGRSFDVVSVKLNNDDLVEPTEEFFIEIVNIHFTTGSFNVITGNINMAQGIILDDDGTYIKYVYVYDVQYKKFTVFDSIGTKNLFYFLSCLALGLQLCDYVE